MLVKLLEDLIYVCHFAGRRGELVGEDLLLFLVQNADIPQLALKLRQLVFFFFGMTFFTGFDILVLTGLSFLDKVALVDRF